MKKIKFAPREIFEQILEYAVIPTFDLVLEYKNQGVIFVKRKIPPYQNKWSLPGLRIFKPESIEDVLKRIAKQEIGLDIKPEEKIFLGQYVGRFKTEHNRQDLSTGYYLKVSNNQKIIINPEHFNSYIVSNKIPMNTGAMYKFYFGRYEELKSRGTII